MNGVLCSGAIVYDTLVRPAGDAPWGTTTFVDTIEWQVGGNGANTSIALAVLGTPVRLVGVIGNDEPGRFVLSALTRAAVDTQAIEVSPAPTAATIVMVDHDGNRKFYHRMGASDGAFAAPIDFTPALTAGISHFHLASLFILPRMRAHAPETLARARAAGLATSLDTNWDPEGRWMADLAPCLPHLDYIFINEDEARMATGFSDPASAARCLLNSGVRTAVMKLGGRGCAVYTAAGEILCPAFDVEVSDTTGAGDCFVAGFLAALRRDESLADAARYANAVGALSVRKVGAVTGLVPDPVVRQWMASARARGA